MREVLKLVTVPKTRLYLASYEPFYYLVFLGIVVFLPASVILFVRLCMKSVDFLRMVVISSPGPNAHVWSSSEVELIESFRCVFGVAKLSFS